MNDKGRIERRLRRLMGMSAERRAEVQKAAGSQLWWARCWNCRKPVTALRRELEESNCPHCGVNLRKRS